MAQQMIDMAKSEERLTPSSMKKGKGRSKEKGVLELEGMTKTPFKGYLIHFVPNWVQLRYLQWRESNRVYDENGIAQFTADGEPLYDETKPRTYTNPNHDPQQFVSFGLKGKKRREKKEKTPEEELAAKERSRERHRNYYRTHTKPRNEEMKRLAELEAAAAASESPVLTVDLTDIKPMEPNILDFAQPTPFDEAEELARTEAHIEQLDKETQSLGTRSREEGEVQEQHAVSSEEKPRKKKKAVRKNN